ncbi:MAG: polysaccharide deacetylase family protein [Candidatus Bathyarchaeia archaeon]|nr:polysaccharide deacetylase family protein [Candidatus Bathyarchaeota archaeon]
MDCERLFSYPNVGGSSIEYFIDVVSSYGFKATFFIVPEAAYKYRDILLEAMGRGFELGLHYHPQSFRNGLWKNYLASYSYRDQLYQLREALNDWDMYLGFKPRCFRPGNFSANIDTYRAIYNLGFREGSCYIPGRVRPEWYAVWSDSPPYPHHIEDIDFLDIPVTADIRFKPSIGDPPHLRIESGSLEYLKDILSWWLQHISSIDTPLKTIVAMTHNTIDYSKGSEERYKLEGLIQAIIEVEDMGLTIKPSTLKEVHEIADRLPYRI